MYDDIDEMYVMYVITGKFCVGVPLNIDEMYNVLCNLLMTVLGEPVKQRVLGSYEQPFIKVNYEMQMEEFKLIDVIVIFVNYIFRELLKKGCLRSVW